MLFIKVVKVQKVCIFYPWRFFIAVFANIEFLRNFHLKAGMALRKVCVRDFGALVVRRFAYAKTGCVRDSRRREKSRRVRKIAQERKIVYVKSSTQNRVEYAKIESRTQIAYVNCVAYANCVRKSRTPNHHS